MLSIFVKNSHDFRLKKRLYRKNTNIKDKNNEKKLKKIIIVIYYN